MPLASRSSATSPFTDFERMVEAACTAASAAAARTSASACASASAILLSAVLVRRATKSSILALALAAMRSASALALVTISSASRSALARRALYSASTLAASSFRRRASSSSALMRSLRWSSAVNIVRCTPSHANTPIRMTNAIATQVSGSSNIGLSLQRGVDRGFYRLAVGRGTGQALHDGAGGIGRNAAHIAHRGGAGRGDGLLGIGEPGRELALQRLAVHLGGRVQLLAGLGADRLRLGARGGEFVFIGLQRRLGLVLQLLRLGEIALDLVLTRIDHRADARQRDARDDDVERDKEDDQRDQLRGEGGRVERRKVSAVLTAFRFGVGAGLLAMTVSHGVLLLRSCAPRGSGARRCHSENEQQEQRDQQREDAERFGQGEAEDQVAELARGCGRIAHRGGEIVAEDDAHADARTAHADARDARADKFCCCRFHFLLLEERQV